MYKNTHTHTQQQTTITTKSTKQYPLIYLVQYKMMRRVILSNIVVLLLVQLPQDAKAWIGSLPTLKKSNTRINTSPPSSRIITLLKDTSNDSNVPIEETQTERLSKSIPQCHYKVGNKWKKRIQLHELKQGQKIVGEKISNADLLKGKTGPKIFFECGVGRVNSKGKWQMVSGMLRVSKNYSKPKIVKKKVKRLSNQEIELYVHIIRLNEGKLEVCTSIEELEREMEKRESKNIISVSSLKENQEVVGTVVDVRPYGVMVDVGANRKGLLHIQKVADLYKKYIDKESGLIEAGLERGAKLRLVVSSIEKKKLFLDFTPETIDIAVEEAAAKEAKNAKEQQVSKIVETEQEEKESTIDNDEDIIDPYADEAAAWAAAYADDYAEEEGDEDKDIEDAFGIGHY